ncbi:MAG TPA: hypothetical protein VGH87_10345 [Polyangiaceae bacterium]|jgi:hypothetical protein|nr:hypothetical protein [Polyangiaceae bacterium]
MTRKALFSLAIVMGALARQGDVRACSCVGPHLAFLSPSTSAAPTNARVRVMAPSTGFVASQLVLRVHGGAVIATTAKTYPEPIVTIVELVPNALLPASTRFEIASTDPSAHPPTTVIGTFTTGTAADTTAPRLDSLGKQRTRLNANFGGGMCTIAGPWIELEDFVAHDDRADAQLVFGVWAPNASGVIDTTRQPDAILFPYERHLAIGHTSLCDPRRFAFSGSVVSLAVAAFDESGNMSRAIRLRADLTKNTP